jgi:hypothetical protein
LDFYVSYTYILATFDSTWKKSDLSFPKSKDVSPEGAITPHPHRKSQKSPHYLQQDKATYQTEYPPKILSISSTNPCFLKKQSTSTANASYKTRNSNRERSILHNLQISWAPPAVPTVNAKWLPPTKEMQARVSNYLSQM